MMTSVILLVFSSSSELQFLQSDYFLSEISSLDDLGEDLENISDDNPGPKSKDLACKIYIKWYLETTLMRQTVRNMKLLETYLLHLCDIFIIFCPFILTILYTQTMCQ